MRHPLRRALLWSAAALLFALPVGLWLRAQAEARSTPTGLESTPAPHASIPRGEPLVDTAGGIDPERFGQGIRELEFTLYRSGPTTQDALEKVFVQAGSLAAGLRAYSRYPGTLQDQERVALERAAAQVETLKQAALLALIHWNRQSSLSLLRQRWETERARLFRESTWFRRGEPDLDAIQAKRDPEGDGDLHAIVAELQLVADRCAGLESWSYAWALEVIEATRNRRPRHHDIRGPVRVVIPYRDKNAYGPKELLSVYEELDYVRALLKTEAGTYHWVKAERSRRIARAVTDALDVARRNLARLEE